MYTLGVSLEEYVSFLWKLFWRIASGTPPDLCFWKPDAKILYAPIDSIIADEPPKRIKAAKKRTRRRSIVQEAAF